MAYFKGRAEDFAVHEEMQLHLNKKGDYVYYLLKKKDWASFEAFEEISRKSGIRVGDIGLAGLKDKKAVTEQHISIPRRSEKLLRKARIKDMSFDFLGYGDERIVIGMLEGNRFTIVVRELDEKKDLSISTVRNYFDQQRFGTKTVAVGRALVQHDFERACALLNIKIQDNNHIAALRKFHRRLLRFYLNSYQSWMWNTVVEKIPTKITKVPLLGYLTEFSDKSVEKEYKTLMKKEKIGLEHFLMKPFPELSTEGNERDVNFPVREFTSTWGWDELHSGKYKCTLSFFLPKGCYATLVVKELFPGVKDKSI